MPHMATSPFSINGLEDGRADGARDAALIAQCPTRPPVGHDPRKAWSWQYKRGYAEVFGPARAHRCTVRCAK